MSDSLYVKVGNAVEQLDLGAGGSSMAPEYVERIEALEAFAETQAAKDEGQDAAIAEAKSSVTTLDTTLRDLIADVGGEAETAKNSVPTGTVIAFAANSEPPGGYLLCNGAAVSRTTYAALFSAIGTTYGTGDGSTTFNLPNLTDKFIQGSGTAGTSKSAGLPNITGAVTLFGVQALQNVQGAYTDRGGSSQSNAGHSSTTITKDFGFDARKSNSIYGASSTVQPPALTMRFYIKY